MNLEDTLTTDVRAGYGERPVNGRRKALLVEAEELVNGPRSQKYGQPVDNFRRIANLWTAYLDGKTGPLTVADAALMQALIKVARLRETPGHRDSWVDLAGYAAAGFDGHTDTILGEEG
jgi:hypothetical protein